MQRRSFIADALLLLTAIVWGGGFVAQRAGMDHIGPFAFNGLRFLLAAGPIWWLVHLRRRTEPDRLPGTRAWTYGLLAGAALFGGATFQQIGLVYTTAGKAGFITGLYVVLVPLLGMAIGGRTPWATWVGAIAAVVGLYLLSVPPDVDWANENVRREMIGNAFEVVGALCWAIHLLLIERLSQRVRPTRLAAMQFVVCALLSLAVSVVFETWTLAGVRAATIPILYGGLIAVGIGYTLQIVGQKHAPAAHAAIILSLEAVFAALAGWLLLDELFAGRAVLGGALMLAGMLVSQLVALHDRSAKAVKWHEPA